MTTATRRTYDPDGTRAAILDSARRLFGHHGYEETSVRELAATAGVTKGAFYHHYTSKEEVLEELHATFLEDLRQDFEKAIADPDARPEDKLRALMVAMLERVDRHQDIVLVFAQQTRHLDRTRIRTLLERQAALDHLVLRLVTDAIEDGDFRRDLDPYAATYGILGLCTWAYRWRQPDGRLSATDTAEVFASLVLGGLTVSDRQPQGPARRTGH